MSFRRLKAVTKKELLHIVRDVRSLALALALPLVMLLLFGYALTLDVDRIPTYVYDQDQTPAEPRIDRPISRLALFRDHARCARLPDRSTAPSIRSTILLSIVVPKRLRASICSPAKKPTCRC